MDVATFCQAVHWHHDGQTQLARAKGLLGSHAPAPCSAMLMPSRRGTPTQEDPT